MIPLFPSHILLAFVLFSTIFSSFQEHDFYKIWQKKNKLSKRHKRKTRTQQEGKMSI